MVKYNIKFLLHIDMLIQNQIQPLFRWAGSKKKLLPELILYWKNSDAIRYN